MTHKTLYKKKRMSNVHGLKKRLDSKTRLFSNPPGRYGGFHETGTHSYLFTHG